MKKIRHLMEQESCYYCRGTFPELCPICRGFGFLRKYLTLHPDGGREVERRAL